MASMYGLSASSYERSEITLGRCTLVRSVAETSAESDFEVAFIGT